MEVTQLPLSGLKLIRPVVYPDQRGFFVETYRSERYARAGIDCTFVQDNHSRSAQGTLRGLHYQHTPGQAKLMRVGKGRIFDVAVDIRADSPSFGRWHGVYLDDEEHLQLFVPVGFAHGFCVVSEVADVLYKVTTPYDPATERTLRWNDPEIGVEWPVVAPILSARDEQGESLAELRKRLTARH
jgi:dTDP-4-dehydrorhamnose 3,5-epimerase